MGFGGRNRGTAKETKKKIPNSPRQRPWAPTNLADKVMASLDPPGDMAEAESWKANPKLDLKKILINAYDGRTTSGLDKAISRMECREGHDRMALSIMKKLAENCQAVREDSKIQCGGDG